MPVLADDCFVTSGELMRHDAALALLEARMAPITTTEAVPITEAAGRILGEEVVARGPVPGHDNAAVDGYAFAADEYDPAEGGRWPLAGRAAAGHAMSEPVAAGHAARILTGAVVPTPCDTVVMQEDVTITNDRDATVVLVPPGLKRGANVRRAGEDVRSGDLLYRAGHVIRPHDVATLASIGRSHVPCHARLRVAIVSSGDEVVRPATGARLAHGQVYDANAPMLQALLDGLGIEAVDLGVWPDDAAVVRARLADAAIWFDVVVISGGASRGEEDHMAAAVEALGTRHLWQLAIKPGRPISFGRIGTCVILGLPGNPVAVFVCFAMYARPVLLRLAGGNWTEPRRWMLPACFDFEGRKRGRREFWRGMLVEETTEEGARRVVGVDKFPRDGSGLLTSLRVADGLIEIPEDAGDVTKGEFVAFIPFTEFGMG